MVTRREMIGGVSSCLVGGAAVALDEYGVPWIGADGRETSTDDTGGCRSGLLDPPRTDAFQFVNILRLDELRVSLQFDESHRVDEVVVRTNGTVVHVERAPASGRHTVSFDGGRATTFELEARAGTDVVGTAEFYSQCHDRDA